MKSYLIRKRDAMLASAGLFWLPSGMDADDALAAYLFMGVGSIGAALTDLTGHGRTLTVGTEDGNTPSWDPDKGFIWSTVYGVHQGYLNNANLNAQPIRAAVCRYANIKLSNRCWLITAGGSTGLAQLTAATSMWDTDTSAVVTRSGPGYVSADGKWTSSNIGLGSGVVGANFGSSSALYINGNRAVAYVATTNADTGKGDSQSWRTFGNTHAAKSDLNNANHSGKTIIAAAFFSRALSADEHKEISQRMADL